MTCGRYREVVDLAGSIVLDEAIVSADATENVAAGAYSLKLLMNQVYY